MLPKYMGVGWHHLSLFDKVGLLLRPSVAIASLSYSDREERVALFNESVELRNVEVNGVQREKVIINTLGYGIQVDTVVYLVGLQFLSGQEEATAEAVLPLRTPAWGQSKGDRAQSADHYRKSFSEPVGGIIENYGKPA